MLVILLLLALFFGVIAFIIYLPTIIGFVGGVMAFYGLLIWRMLQSFWKQKIWTLAVWFLLAFPLIMIMIFADHSLTMFGLFAAWTFFISSIATIICYRDGRPLKQAP